MQAQVLHLEDRPRSVERARRLLENSGVAYLRAQTKEQFAEALARGTVALVLSAASTSSFDGLEALAYLKAIAPEVPFIFWTTAAEKKALLQRAGRGTWDVISTSEVERLRVAVSLAAELAALRRSNAALEMELSQAKDLLLKTHRSVVLGRLLSSIAHEINNPLEGVANLLFLAQQSLSDPKYMKTCVTMAEEELQRVGAITKQMLSFHRDSRDIQKVSVTETIENVLTLHRGRIERRRIEVVRQFRSAAFLNAYPGEIRQMLSNMITNAVDAMPNGGRLILRVQQRPKENSKLYVTIADTGTGIPREVSRRIGELFFTTKGESGTGLGMWISRQLLAKYGGAFRLYSSTTPGRSGTTFRLEFPNAQARLDDSSTAGIATITLQSDAGRTSESQQTGADSAPKIA